MIRFTVLGRPAPQGSKNHVGNGVMVESSKRLKPWRQEIGYTAMCQSGRNPEFSGAVRLYVDFYFAPPKKMPKDRKGMTTKPDGDKLLRGVFDAVKGVLYRDDAQVVDARPRKFYGLPERAEIELEYL